MQTQTFSVSGISCGNCIGEIKEAFSDTNEFYAIEVLRNPDRLKLEIATPTTSEAINEMFEKFGLVKYRVEDLQSQSVSKSEPSIFAQLYPLTLVISYLLIGVCTVAWSTSNFSLDKMMFHYMAGFFLVFSFFKFLNIKGFADAFRTYDPLAKAWRPYGYIYASFELLAGIGYLLAPQSLLLNTLVLVLLAISSYGVVKAVKSKSRIQCACLGTVFNLPMTKVTIVENVSMMTMASFIIFKVFV